MRKSSITVLLLLLIVAPGRTQTRETMIINKSYDLAKIYTKDHKITKGRNLTLVNDSIIAYKNNTSYENVNVNLSQVNSIKIKSGTRVVPFALYGAGLMGLSSLYAILQIEADPYTELKPNAGGIIAGFIAGGAVIGGLVGLASPKWKSISIPRKTPGNAPLSLTPSLEFQNNSYSLGFYVRF